MLATCLRGTGTGPAARLTVSDRAEGFLLRAWGLRKHDGDWRVGRTAVRPTCAVASGCRSTR
ncbi:MAG: hypothetical protein D6725_14305 [Planctomycetota bacterium]|nr:MAG: hypothetical protein D6725_14305 [Planctomycetota bacterium]